MATVKTFWAIIAAAALTLTACGGDDDGSSKGDLGDLAKAVADAPLCTTLFEPDRPTADVVADAEDPGLCTHGGEAILTDLESFPCTSDPARIVHYYTSAATDGTTSGYGIDGDTWQPMPDGQDAPNADVC